MLAGLSYHLVLRTLFQFPLGPWQDSVSCCWSPFSCWLGVVVCYHFKKLLMIFDMCPPAFSKLTVEYFLLCFEHFPSKPT